MAGFRLASLLKVRRIQEDQAAAQLTQARHSARGVQRRAADERELLEDLGGQAALAAAGIARASAARQLAEIRAAQQVADGEVQAAEKALMLARQSRRSVELLKERHDASLRVLEAKAEQHALDELASTQHAQKTSAQHAQKTRTEGES
ncbi:flagellar FliJ family protein [Citricoccus parietis]|uniref:Flagellar FliJ protein n=2 Tax=Citricoccus parietis TaxID=592307 RepID=A0ABV5FYT4_9MICC